MKASLWGKRRISLLYIIDPLEVHGIFTHGVQAVMKGYSETSTANLTVGHSEHTEQRASDYRLDPEALPLA